MEKKSAGSGSAEHHARALSSRHVAVASVRTAVRRFLGEAKTARLLTTGELAVAVSGGADSLALIALTVPLAEKLGIRVRALIVDHGLQAGSAAVAARAAEVVFGLGASPEVLGVRVGARGGIEAAARRARYAALRSAVPAGVLVLLGHTQDDQAETVLLGLGRGSGPRSIAGMLPLDPPWGRPLLDVSRADTTAACSALGLSPWADPHNADPRFTRVRLRGEVLPLLEDVLAGGVSAALARTATQLREDLAVLDDLGRHLYLRAVNPDGGHQRDFRDEGHHQAEKRDEGHHQVDMAIEVLVDAPAALRRRALRLWLLDAGVSELTDRQIRAVDDLVERWRGQGGVHLPGGLVVRRAHGRLSVFAGAASPKE